MLWASWNKPVAAVPSGSGVLDSWELTGHHAPHDIALSAAPIGATVGGSRSLAVYVAEAARGGRPSALHKLIVHHPSASLLPPLLLQGSVSGIQNFQRPQLLLNSFWDRLVNDLLKQGNISDGRQCPADSLSDAEASG